MFVKISEQPSLYNDLEKKSVREILEDINTEDQKVALAVQRAIPQIEKLVTQIVPRMKQGGRIFYMGAGIGAGIRPVGGWLADRLDSGSKVTLVSLFIMLAASIVVLFGIQTHAFALFFGSFLLLFLTTAFINGASFRMIPYIFDNPFHASLVTGFTAAIAAYGAFLIPKIFGWSYANFQNVAPAFYILIAFTVLTIIITWFFYARKGSGIKC